MSAQAEVVLIGIGGIGSSIVNDLYKRVKDRGIDEVSAIVVDTDINDLSKRTNIEPQYRIQTSAIGTVYSKLTDEDKEFFPEHPSFNRMQMTDGAGMIRAISYLAFKKAEEAGKFNVIDNLVNDVYRIGNSITEKSVKIVVVSSLMGGTGSGMFLALPLLIRDKFENKYATDKVDITGYFVMPEVMQGIIPDVRKEEIFANTYASLRELNGLTLSALSEDVVINMQYKGKQLDANGNRKLEVDRVPYDKCFFVNNTNMKGETLDNANEAFEMLKNIIDEYYFGELSGKINSRMVNNITGIVAGGGTNIYGGIALSKLIYPYEEIVDFVNVSWLQKSMKENLLFIDRQYQVKLNQYKEDEKRGISSTKPEIINTYIDIFETEAQNEMLNTCKKINNKIVGKNADENRLIKIKKALGMEILKCINEDDVLNEKIANLKSNVKVISSQNKNYEILERKVADIAEIETGIKKYIDETAINKTKTKAKTLLGLVSEDDVTRSILYKNLEGIHIIGQRYIIYKLISEYTAKIIELKAEQSKYLNKISNLTNAYENNRGQKVDAVQKAREVVNQKGMFGKKIKKFRNEFLENTTAYLKTLNAYNDVTNKIYAYEEMIKVLNEIGKVFEKFFNNIDDISKSLDNELLAKKEKALEGKNSVTRKVLASSEHKERIFKEIEGKLDYQTLFEKFSINVFEILYKEYIKKEILQTNKLDINYKKIFEEQIQEHCREEIKKASVEYLDFDIHEALRKEAEYLNIEFDKHLNSRIKEIVKNAYPWIRLDENAIAHTDILMSVNEDVYNDFNDKSILHDSMVILGPADVIVNDQIDNKTIKIINIKSTIHLHDLRETKVMYEHYKNKIDKLPVDGLNTVHCKTITPHIDKRWHKILPYIDEESRRISLEEYLKSFLLGFITDSFKKSKNIEKDGYTFSFIDKSTTPISITKQGKEIKDSYNELLELIKFDQAKKSSILEKYEDYILETKQQGSYFDFENKQTILEVPNIAKMIDISISVSNPEHYTFLDIIINIYKDMSLNKRELPDSTEILTTLIEMVKEIVKENVANFAITDKSLKEIEEIVFKAIVEKSKLKQEIEKDSSQYLKLVNPLLV